MTIVAALVTFILLVATIVSGAIITAECNHRKWLRQYHALEAARRAQRQEYEAVKKSDGLRPQ